MQNKIKNDKLIESLIAVNKKSIFFKAYVKYEPAMDGSYQQFKDMQNQIPFEDYLLAQALPDLKAEQYVDADYSKKAYHALNPIFQSENNWTFAIKTCINHANLAVEKKLMRTLTQAINLQTKLSIKFSTIVTENLGKESMHLLDYVILIISTSNAPKVVFVPDAENSKLKEQTYVSFNDFESTCLDSAYYNQENSYVKPVIINMPKNYVASNLVRSINQKPLDLKKLQLIYDQAIEKIKKIRVMRSYSIFLKLTPVSDLTILQALIYSRMINNSEINLSYNSYNYKKFKPIEPSDLAKYPELINYLKQFV